MLRKTSLLVIWIAEMLFMGIVPDAEAQVRSTQEYDFSEFSREGLVFEFDRLQSLKQLNYCTLKALTNEMLERGGFDGPVRFEHDFAAYNCAISNNAWPTAHTFMTQMEQRNEAVFGTVAIQISFFAEEYDEAAVRLSAAAYEDDSANLLRLPTDFYWSMARKFRRLDRKDLERTMARDMFQSPHFEKLDVTLQSGIIAQNLDLAAEEGDFENAAALVAKLSSPKQYRTRLVDRKFEPIWPLLQDTAGKNLTKATRHYSEQQLALYNADKSDRKAFQKAVHALYYDARFADAISLARTYSHNRDGYEKLTQDDAWALNIEAYALDALGKEKAALAVFDNILRSDAPRSKFWLINFAINRASFLAGSGKWRQALKAADIAQEYPKSDYAQMLIWRARVCANAGLGRMEAASDVMQKMLDAKDVTPSIPAAALLCLRRYEEAAQLTIKGLRDDKWQQSMIVALQPPEYEIFYAMDNLPKLYDLLMARPDVEAVFSEYGRIMPADLMPLNGIKRAEAEALQ